VVLGAALLGAAVLGLAMKPSERIADGQPPLDLQALIPAQFGEWQVDPTVMPVTVSPDVRAKLDKIYDQTLSRTYIDKSGRRIMLSIAYGGDQGGESMQVHRPEYCYAAQGFEILSGEVDSMRTRFGTLEVRRLLAQKGPRHEPITYWLTVGDRAALPGWKRKMLQIGYGLSGKVPDGVLVRVSSIERNSATAFAAQDAFVQSLLDTLQSGGRARLIGALAG
jgi:EpsI family protein